MLSIARMNSLVFSLVFLIFKGVLTLDEECKKNSDCSTINSLCLDGRCNCHDLSYYNDSQCLQYVTEYNGICQDSKQCDWLGNNSECRQSRCVCLEGFRWYKGTCQKYVDKGGNCTSDDECYNGYDLLSLTCSKGICDCSSYNYYSREYDCRKSSSDGGDCALTLDCQSSSLTCVLGKCSNDSTENFNEQYLEIPKVQPNAIKLTFEQSDISCENDGDCVDMANSLCDVSKKTCGCNEDTHFLYNGNCIQGLSHCDNNSDCTGTDKNTMCFRNSSCICKQGFFLKDQKCIAELGMPDSHADYQVDSDCPIKPGHVEDSICYCKNYWFNDASNRNCIKTMIESTHSCLTNEWCSVMGPYSFCNSTTSTCQCSSIAKFNEDTYYCERTSDNPDICLRDEGCNINERCLDEKCQCVENFSRNDEDLCVPEVEGPCEGSCSHIENALCVGGTCKCDVNYVGKQTKCLKVADSLEDPCEEQEQCSNLVHTVCGESEVEYVTSEYNATLRCVCEEAYTEVDDVCLQVKKYGDPCMTEADCTSVLNRSYKCRNSRCQCNVGQSLKNGYCTSSANIVIASSLLWLGIFIKLGLW